MHHGRSFSQDIYLTVLAVLTLVIAVPNTTGYTYDNRSPETRTDWAPGVHGFIFVSRMGQRLGAPYNAHCCAVGLLENFRDIV